MTALAKKSASPVMVVIAFAIVYLVWGSTYFFIQQAIQHIPPMLMGAMRFTAAGVLLMLWCVIKGEDVFNWQQIKPAIISGLLLLFVGTGIVIWVEKTLPSSLVAVLLSSQPAWFIVLDKRNWKSNFSNRNIVVGLVVGFAGVVLLFSERVAAALNSSANNVQVFSLVILLVGAISWCGGSLYSKYRSKGPAVVSSAWQMLAAGFAFLPASLIDDEWRGFSWGSVTIGSWLSVLYLVLMGSLAAYSAYVWLLQVRPATQVSTHAYVNPVVAVLLGVFFGGEHITWLQVAGLAIILFSVLLINLAKYRNEKVVVVQADDATRVMLTSNKPLLQKTAE